MKTSAEISSEKSVIFALIGAAIGLGNIWRFPYIAAENGGSLFFLAYVIFVILLGVPIMLCEIVIGRIGRSTPANCIQSLAIKSNKSIHWTKISWLGKLTATIILSFYATISGIIIYYLGNSIVNNLPITNFTDSTYIFNQLQQSPLKIIAFDFLFILLTFFVSSKQVSQGIAKLNYLMMPIMYLLLILLVLYVSNLSGFRQAITYLFAFKLEAVSKTMLIEAMGHALFTLAAGACCLMAYGAYMPNKQSILKAISIVIVMDVLVAVLAGITIFSILFSENVAINHGPGLMFLSLPVALSKIYAGSIIQSIFFLLLLAAAWTSAVNLAEPLVVTIQDKFAITRKYSAIISACIVFLLSIIPCLALNIWDVTVPYFNRSVFELYTGMATEVLLPVTGLLILIFTSKVLTNKDLASQLFLPNYLGSLVLYLIKYISPVLILILIFNGIFSEAL